MSTTTRGPRVGVDVLAALALFAIAGVLLSQTGDGVRDWVMPRSLNYLLVGIGVVLLAKGLLRPGATVPVIPSVLQGRGTDVAVFIAVAIAYVLVMPVVGFWVTSTVVIFALSLVLAEHRDRRTVVESAVVAVGVCAVFYVLMLHVFYVPLPEGRLLPL
ncbi:MAG: tripartite tricarboxylate transporter TctB family protein [Nocardioidaceae bacterium]